MGGAVEIHLPPVEKKKEERLGRRMLVPKNGEREEWVINFSVMQRDLKRKTWLFLKFRVL